MVKIVNSVVVIMIRHFLASKSHPADSRIWYAVRTPYCNEVCAQAIKVAVTCARLLSHSEHNNQLYGQWIGIPHQRWRELPDDRYNDAVQSNACLRRVAEYQRRVYLVFLFVAVFSLLSPPKEEDTFALKKLNVSCLTRWIEDSKVLSNTQARPLPSVNV